MSKKFQENNSIRIKIAQKLDAIEQDYRRLEWLTTEEVCELLKIHPQTLAQYRKRKQIPYSKIGRKCYYPVQGIKNLLYDDLKSDEL